MYSFLKDFSYLNKNVLIFCFSTICYTLNFPTPVIGINCGRTANEGEFSFMALLLEKKDYGDWSPMCGGSVLNSHWIVTAGHCFDSFVNMKDIQENLTVQAGTILVTPDSKYQYKVDFAVSHPGYDKTSVHFHDDIGLVRVTEQMKFNYHLNKIDIAKNFYFHSKVLVSMAGWGWTTRSPCVSRKLQILSKLKITEKATCEEYIHISKNQICVMEESNRGPCAGDSGGPVVLTRNTLSKSKYLVGIISFGASKSCADGKPELFTYVPAYTKWINEVVDFHTSNLEVSISINIH